MFIVFTRFGTLFRVVFSSLWSKTRLLFNFSRSRGIEPDGISHPPPGSAQGCTSDFPRGYTPNLVAISTLATASLPTGMAVTSAKYPFSCPVKAVDPPHLAHSLMPGVSNKQDRDIAFHNPEAPIDVRRPLGSITNTYGQASGGDHVPHRSRTPTFKRVTAYPDLRSGSQLSASGCSPAINATPGSLAWHSDKAKLLDEARAWNTRVKTESAARRLSLPLPPSSTSFSAPQPTLRRASAPANLGNPRRTLEERLQSAIAGCRNVTLAVPGEPQFIIGEDENDYFEGDTWVADSFTSDKAASTSAAGTSELPYLRPASVLLPSESLSSSGSDGTLTEMIDALEAIFSTSKWQSLVDLEGAAARQESRLRSIGSPLA